jgi:hypothetical protein
MVKSKRFHKQRCGKKNINTRRSYNTGGSASSTKHSPSPTDYDDAELDPVLPVLPVTNPQKKYTPQFNKFLKFMRSRSTGLLPHSRTGVLSKSGLARHVMHKFITGSSQPAYLKKLLPDQKLLVHMFRTNYVPIITTDFREPTIIALDRDGNIAVADNQNHRICVYNPITGSILRSFTSLYVRSISFMFNENGLTDELIVSRRDGVFLVNYVTGQPIRSIVSATGDVSDVAFDGSFNVRFKDKILYYTRSGVHDKENTVKIPGLGPMAYYTKNKFKANEPILVADSANGHIYETSYGEVFPVLERGTGTGWGQFKGIGGIAVDCVGNVIVTDKGNHRVHIFTPDFTKALIIGKLGDAYGDFNNPTGVAVDCRGNIFVCDTGNNRIQVIRYRI